MPELRYPFYDVTTSGGDDNLNFTVSIDDYTESVAPGLTGELLRAMADTIAARQEFAGATVTRSGITQTDVTPTASA